MTDTDIAIRLAAAEAENVALRDELKKARTALDNALGNHARILRQNGELNVLNKDLEAKAKAAEAVPGKGVK